MSLEVELSGRQECLARERKSLGEIVSSRPHTESLLFFRPPALHQGGVLCEPPRNGHAPVASSSNELRAVVIRK